MNDIPGLEKPHQAALAAMLEPLRGSSRLYLFGSRARGAWRRHSDIDILVDGDGPVPIELLARVETAIAESDLPVSVDLVDARRASAEFIAAISGELRAV